MYKTQLFEKILALKGNSLNETYHHVGRLHLWNVFKNQNIWKSSMAMEKKDGFTHVLTLLFMEIYFKKEKRGQKSNTNTFYFFYLFMNKKNHTHK